jgi:hypothetical protein
MRHPRHKNQAGITFVELIFTAAISVMVFGAIFVSFQYTLELVAFTRAKLSALSLANDRMEYFRSLPYDDVGVVAGFPAGTIPQTSSLTLNDINFFERVRVDYVDDAADGLLSLDTNLIEEDYKHIRLNYEWSLNGETRSVSMASYIVPRSIETDVGGGTIRINVLDSSAAPLEDASVTVTNAGNGYAVTNPTSADGTALFSVAADADYEVLVTGFIGGNQYSTSSTHRISVANPNPSSAPFAVGEAGISTQTFLIGPVSDLAITTKSAIIEGSILESFPDSAGIASTTDTTVVTSDELVLMDSLGVYLTAGEAYLDVATPLVLERWETIRVAASVPVNTDYVIRLYTGSTTTAFTPVPDSDLPGNSTGFADSLIDISGLDPVLYPTTTIGVSLVTTDTSVTPAIDEIAVFWRESETVLPNHSMYIRGEKLIGTDSGAQPIYKATSTITSDGVGEIMLSDFEFDTYVATSTAVYDLASACPSNPFLHEAGVDGDLELLIVASAAHTLRVVVQDTFGRPVPGVTVTLERSGYDVTQFTNTCGQTFFTGGLTDNSDYELTVSAAGFITEVIDPFVVTGDTLIETVLSI